MTTLGVGTSLLEKHDPLAYTAIKTIRAGYVIATYPERALAFALWAAAAAILQGPYVLVVLAAVPFFVSFVSTIVLTVFPNGSLGTVFRPMLEGVVLTQGPIMAALFLFLFLGFLGPFVFAVAAAATLAPLLAFEVWLGDWMQHKKGIELTRTKKFLLAQSAADNPAARAVFLRRQARRIQKEWPEICSRIPGLTDVAQTGKSRTKFSVGFQVRQTNVTRRLRLRKIGAEAKQITFGTFAPRGRDPEEFEENQRIIVAELAAVSRLTVTVKDVTDVSLTFTMADPGVKSRSVPVEGDPTSPKTTEPEAAMFAGWSEDSEEIVHADGY